MRRPPSGGRLSFWEASCLSASQSLSESGRAEQAFQGDPSTLAQPGLERTLHIGGLHLHEDLTLALRVPLNRDEHDVVATFGFKAIVQRLDGDEVLRRFSGKSNHSTMKLSNEFRKKTPGQFVALFAQYPDFPTIVKDLPCRYLVA